jgi:hypothetical protein
MLGHSARDPSRDRKKLIGAWECIEQKGYQGMGSFRRTVRKYEFNSDGTYKYGYDRVSSYQTPPINPYQVHYGPTRTVDNRSGVYLVGNKDDEPLLCLCAEKEREAVVGPFSFLRAELKTGGSLYRQLR